jgi:hypothetical protein
VGEITEETTSCPSDLKWRRAWKLNLIEGGNPQWRDLYEDLLVPQHLRRYDDPWHEER